MKSLNMLLLLFLYTVAALCLVIPECSTAVVTTHKSTPPNRKQTVDVDEKYTNNNNNPRVVQTTYTYSVSSDFPNGIDGQVLHKAIVKADLSGVTITGVTIVGDVVDIIFQDVLTATQEYILDVHVAQHIATSLINQFCADLPDSNVSITEAMVQLGVIVTDCTADRTYTLMTATEMVTSGKNIGNFYFINNGSANATIGMGTGGSTPNDMVVVPGVPAHFMYTVTNKLIGSQAYIVLRVG